MFIPWLSNTLIPDNIMNITIDSRYKFTEKDYENFMADERIKHMLDTNSFYVEGHSYINDHTFEKMMSISLSDAIGKIKSISVDGVEFEKLDTKRVDILFKHIDPNTLKASKNCIFNKNTKEIKLIKINIGYLRGVKFILI